VCSPLESGTSAAAGDGASRADGLTARCHSGARWAPVAVWDFGWAEDRNGSWLCENSSARRARRNISKKLRTMESNRAPRTMFDTLLENCIFYISQLYEFFTQAQRRIDPLATRPGCPLPIQ
jgi:hypothetical protein